MKAIILISSIFYILGLKLSNKIDLIKPGVRNVSKVVKQKSDENKVEKPISYKDAEALKPEKDTTVGGGTAGDVLQYK